MSNDFKNAEGVFERGLSFSWPSTDMKIIFYSDGNWKHFPCFLKIFLLLLQATEMHWNDDVKSYKYWRIDWDVFFIFAYILFQNELS